MANQMPDILRKHVYAVASIAGGIIMAITYNLTNFKSISALLAFISVVILRYLAAKFEWNLPKLS